MVHVVGKFMCFGAKRIVGAPLVQTWIFLLFLVAIYLKRPLWPYNFFFHLFIISFYSIKNPTILIFPSRSNPSPFPNYKKIGCLQPWSKNLHTQRCIYDCLPPSTIWGGQFLELKTFEKIAGFDIGCRLQVCSWFWFGMVWCWILIWFEDKILWLSEMKRENGMRWCLWVKVDRRWLLMKRGWNTHIHTLSLLGPPVLKQQWRNRASIDNVLKLVKSYTFLKCFDVFHIQSIFFTSPICSFLVIVLWCPHWGDKIK